ncbi:MAG: Gfo/Idh/MocA family protein [Pikeienuella sp.]
MRVAVIGLGYFAQFHLRAWAAIEGVELVAVADPSAEARLAAAEFGVKAYVDLASLLAVHNPEIIDIVAPPPFHADLIQQAAKPGRYLVCQKPFCETVEQAHSAIATAKAADAILAIHENFRFQPWYREAKRLIDEGALGAILQARFSLRPGDGRGKEAYLARQPSFQTMPRFLIRETAVHFIDLFQWLFGQIETVYAETRRLNPVIKGEDDGLLIMNHAGGTRSEISANRLSDHAATDRRRTMGEMLVEGENAALRLDGEGQLWLRKFGSNDESPVQLKKPIDLSNFGGGCVEALCRHVAKAAPAGDNPENLASEYLRVQEIADMAYRSAEEGRRLKIK